MLVCNKNKSKRQHTTQTKVSKEHGLFRFGKIFKNKHIKLGMPGKTFHQIQKACLHVGKLHGLRAYLAGIAGIDDQGEDAKAKHQSCTAPSARPTVELLVEYVDVDDQTIVLFERQAYVDQNTLF